MSFSLETVKDRIKQQESINHNSDIHLQLLKDSLKLLEEHAGDMEVIKEFAERLAWYQQEIGDLRSAIKTGTSAVKIRKLAKKVKAVYVPAIASLGEGGEWKVSFEAKEI